MARTTQGDAVTAQHRRAQNQLSARMQLDWLRLAPIWKVDEDTFDELIDATMTLLIVGYSLSRQLAASYYRAFRFAEEIADDGFVPVLSADLDRGRAAGTLHKVGLEMFQSALHAGRGVADAREQSLVRMSGSVSRQVLEGGRETVIASVAADRQARGWARIAGPNCCAFCAMLAGRGPVYKTAQTASFQAHDHCACGIEPAFGDYEWNAQSREYGDLYDQAIREARAAGEYSRGTSNDSLNALRRLLNRH
jgi:hypothetical protein